MMNTFEKLRDAIATTLKVPVEKITEQTKDENITAWDSLGHVNLMLALEQTFDVYLEVDDFPFSRHERDSAVEILVIQMALDHRVNPLQALGRHPDVLGLGQRRRSPEAGPDQDRGRDNSEDSSAHAADYTGVR